MYCKIWLLVAVVYFLSEAARSKPIDDYSYEILKSKDPSSVCRLPPSGTGICRAFIPSYYYDSASRSCKEFIYGGCKGNANRFESEEECMATCKNVKV